MQKRFYLESSRLILRPFDTRDIEPFALYRSDPGVARYQTWETPFTREQAARFVAGLQQVEPGRPGEWFQVALELKATCELTGDCAFQVLAEDPRQAEIGFTLAPGFQGQGYGTEAVSHLLGYLFQEFNLHRVRANCDPRNTASARLLKRVGMRHEGRFIESYWLKGEWVSEDWYAILRREYPPKPPA